MKINYYYDMYANKLRKNLKINNEMGHEMFAPLKKIAHFGFYRQLTCIEEMRLIEQTDNN